MACFHICSSQRLSLIQCVKYREKKISESCVLLSIGCDTLSMRFRCSVRSPNTLSMYLVVYIVSVCAFGDDSTLSMKCCSIAVSKAIHNISTTDSCISFTVSYVQIRVLLSGLNCEQPYIQSKTECFSILWLSTVHYHFQEPSFHRLSLTGIIDPHSRYLNQTTLIRKTSKFGFDFRSHPKR